MGAINIQPDFKTISEAILNDKHIKELGERLVELYQNSLPTIILDGSECRYEYDPELVELAEKIKLLIEQRKEQIIKANML